MTEQIRFPMGEGIPDIWKEQVRGIVEADSYAQHRLWMDHSREYAQMYPQRVEGRDLRVDWKQGSPGYIHFLKGEHFTTTVSVFVNSLDGHLVLFWTCESQKCDFGAAEEWVRETFKNAVSSSDATNFHNVLHDLKRL